MAYLIEAHSYSGGLVHTPFPLGAPRPSWAPPADSVGWRDEFEFTSNDAVIEFSQRFHLEEEVSWLAVYQRAIDSRFGDRGNHAGIGIWLYRTRIADAYALLTSLQQLTSALVGAGAPQALADQIAEFASDRFLRTYLVAADQLPSNWVGSPAAANALPETKSYGVVAPDLPSALEAIAGAVTSWSLSWDRTKGSPRNLILVTPNPALVEELKLGQPISSATFLADVILHVPEAFETAREAVDAAQRSLADANVRSENEIRALQGRWDDEKRRLESLDGETASLESIARRLNGLSRQVADIQNSIANSQQTIRYEQPIRRNPVAPARRVHPTESESSSIFDSNVVFFSALIIGFLFLVLLIVFLVTRFAP